LRQRKSDRTRAAGDADAPNLGLQPGDAERDLRADLLLCGRATPGPWEWKNGLRAWPGEEIPGYTMPRLVGRGRVILNLKNPGGGLPGPIPDLDLIIESRVGWPVALRRAIAAEAECERLRCLVAGLADRVAAQSELLTARAGRPGA
jgi:hypothetical protein